MSTTRKFGIITNQSAFTGVMLNSVDTNASVDIAECRNESGTVTDLQAYSVGETIAATGVLDTARGNIASPGATLTVESKSYIIDGVNKRETNTGFVEISINGRRADNAVLTPINVSSGIGE